MSQVRIGRWGKNLAVRIPSDIAKSAGLVEGDQVGIEARDGVLVLRLDPEWRRRDAQAAADEIMAEAEHHSLGGVSITELLNEDRR